MLSLLSFLNQRSDSELIALQPKAADHTLTCSRYQRLVTELLTLMHVGDVHLDDRTLQRTDAVVQGHAGVGVGSGIQYNTVVAPKESRLLHLVDQFAFHVTLEIVDLHLWEPLAQFRQVVLERLRAIDARLPLTQQVQVRPVDYQYFHTLFIYVTGCKDTMNFRKTQYFT